MLYVPFDLMIHGWQLTGYNPLDKVNVLIIYVYHFRRVQFYCLTVTVSLVSAFLNSVIDIQIKLSINEIKQPVDE